MTMEEWMKYGWEQGWCSPPVCDMHDGTPMTIAEEDMIFNGEDPCIHIIRLYPDADTASEIVTNHFPTRLRAHTRGWTNLE